MPNLEIVYQIRYEIANLRTRTESAVMTAVEDINNEDPTTPNHANRMAWAHWANINSSIASIYFAWPLAMNPSVQTAVQADPTGLSVTDGDIQYVVNSSLDEVIVECVVNPPAGFNPPVV